MEMHREKCEARAGLVGKRLQRAIWSWQRRRVCTMSSTWDGIRVLNLIISSLKQVLNYFRWMWNQSSFLNDYLKEEVYVKKSPRFDSVEGIARSKSIARLNRAVYVLKQAAARACISKIVSSKFERSQKWQRLNLLRSNIKKKKLEFWIIYLL